MPEQVTIALIGAGRAGTALLNELLKIGYVRILGIADADPKADGILLAREAGVPVFSDPMQLVQKNEEIDILIEASGDALIKQDIKEYFETVGNRKTVILHNIVSRLLISLAAGRPDLAPDFHPHDIGIG